MDMKQIKELMTAMEKAGVKKVKLKEEKGFEVEIERDSEHSAVTHVRHHDPHPHHFAPPASSPPAAKLHADEAPKKAPEGDFITSPMVGTFYEAPSPEDPPFIKVGDVVEEDTVVCIIEAMKVMNEVKAGKKGKIAEILVGNADPVEFGSNLFRIV